MEKINQIKISVKNKLWTILDKIWPKKEKKISTNKETLIDN